MAQIQICLRSVVRDKNLAMLDRIHRARVHVQIRVKLLHRHLVTARLQKTPERCCGDSLAQS